jgi:hypothetical protein
VPPVGEILQHYLLAVLLVEPVAVLVHIADSRDPAVGPVAEGAVATCFGVGCEHRSVGRHQHTERALEARCERTGRSSRAGDVVEDEDLPSGEARRVEAFAVCNRTGIGTEVKARYQPTGLRVGRDDEPRRHLNPRFRSR